jgi:hypothetical protein
MTTSKQILQYFILIAAICLLSLSFSFANALSAESQESAKAIAVPVLSAEEIEKKWGLRPLSIRQTADGYMLDFRYRIIDAEKAAPLFGYKIKTYLIDQASGAVMAVPDVPKVGALRSTRKPINDRNYAMLFANPGKYIKPGNKVTVAIGDLKIENLVVE